MTKLARHSPLRRRLVRSFAAVVYASVFFLSIHFAAPFQAHVHSPKTPSKRYHSQGRDDEGGSASSASSDGSAFDDSAILGETLDVSLSHGTYSWSNPKAIPKDDIRSPNRSSAVAPSGSNRYKRIRFDGCGSILLHQEKKDFVQPKSVSGANDKTGRRLKGRTGVTLWSASYVISHYIDAQWSKGGYWCSDGEAVAEKWTVLELGAGLGLCSAVAAKHGMNVIATDNEPEVLSLLRENLHRNRIHNHGQRQVVQVHPLDWMAVAEDPAAECSHPVFTQLEAIGGADLILLSDLVYGATEPAWESLLVLLNKFRSQRQRLRSGCDLDEGEGDVTIHSGLDDVVRPEDPIVLLGYTQRRRDMSPQDEARFFSIVRAAGMEAALITSSRIPHSEKYMLTSLFELRWL